MLNSLTQFLIEEPTSSNTEKKKKKIYSCSGSLHICLSCYFSLSSIIITCDLVKTSAQIIVSGNIQLRIWVKKSIQYQWMRYRQYIHPQCSEHLVNKYFFFLFFSEETENSSTFSKVLNVIFSLCLCVSFNSCCHVLRPTKRSMSLFFLSLLVSLMSLFFLEWNFLIHQVSDQALCCSPMSTNEHYSCRSRHGPSFIFWSLGQ